MKILKSIKVKSVLLTLLLAATTFACTTREAGNQNEGETASVEIEGEISISGAFALYPLTTRWAEEFRKIHPGVRIHLSAGGAGKGMADALSGLTDLGMFSRNISQSEKDQGVWWVSVCKDAVFPTISDKNTAFEEIKRTGIKQEVFRKIFVSGEITRWGEAFSSGSGDINLFTRSDASGAAEVWAQFLGVHQEDLRGTGIFGDPGVASAVSNDPRGLGFNNTLYIYDINSGKPHPDLAVAPIDLNGNGKLDESEDFYGSLQEVTQAVAEGNYPSPPARELYFVARGKPNSAATTAFLKWVLTKGQQFVGEGGYVPLKQDYINEQLNKL